MGFLTKKADPTVELLKEMIQQQQRQQKDQQEFTESLIEILKDQNHMMVKLMGQYIQQGPNTAENLNERLERKEQQLEAPQWEPLGVNIFEGM